MRLELGSEFTRVLFMSGAWMLGQRFKEEPARGVIRIQSIWLSVKGNPESLGIKPLRGQRMRNKDVAPLVHSNENGISFVI